MYTLCTLMMLACTPGIEQKFDSLSDCQIAAIAAASPGHYPRCEVKL